MFNNDFFIKRRMEKSQMKKFAQCLGDIWESKVTNNEGRTLLRGKLELLAKDRYDLTNEDYSYIETLVDSVFEKNEKDDIIKSGNIVAEQISLI